MMEHAHKPCFHVWAELPSGIMVRDDTCHATRKGAEKVAGQLQRKLGMTIRLRVFKGVKLNGMPKLPRTLGADFDRRAIFDNPGPNVGP